MATVVWSSLILFDLGVVRLCIDGIASLFCKAELSKQHKVVTNVAIEEIGIWIPLVCCLALTGLLSLMTFFVTDLVQFTAIRFMLGIFTGGHSTIVVVYLLENIPMKSRMWINTAISYSPNVIIFAIVAYFFQHWRSLALVISVLHIPAVALMIYLHESPRWLVQKGKIREARHVILRIAEMDGVKTKINESNLDILLQHEHERFEIMGKKRHTFWHVFRKSHLALPLCIISFSFFCSMVINYGNMFNLDSLSGSIYLNSIIVGSLRYSTNLLCGFLDYKFTCFGRKTAHTICQMLVLSLLILSTSIVISGNQSDYKEIVRYCVLVICALASQIVIINAVTCNEFFPTSVRTLCYSFAQLCSRLGIVLAPYVYSWVCLLFIKEQQKYFSSLYDLCVSGQNLAVSGVHFHDHRHVYGYDTFQIIFYSLEDVVLDEAMFKRCRKMYKLPI
ncbi:hypothetical protein DICVIV_11592 [Dictyocaulus viviparus]|uniref:Transporter, major facilitator family protein n=1 Tax=Dictyocaulus viviparus TaxID=29172 RepID=A0A0D8XJC8_DICVI|nr:hypothetical protein DICVIV_11592 [Dictyocaulus viviparus]